MRREALRLSLSADCFKTSNNMNMLGLDVYWISKSWEFKHLTLGLHRLANAVGTADALTSATRSVIESLKLKQQVYAIASDTTAVMPAYVKQMKACWSPCLDHHLQLVLKKSLIADQSPQKLLFDRVCNCVNWALEKPKVIELVRSVQDELLKNTVNPHVKTLFTNHSPRFAVWVDVLERAYQLRHVLTRAWSLYAELYRDAIPSLPTSDEWAAISLLLPLLVHFRNFIYQVEGESRVLAVSYYPHLHLFRQTYLEASNLDTPAVKCFKDTARDIWTEKFDTEIRVPALVASWLSPYWHNRFYPIAWNQQQGQNLVDTTNTYIRNLALTLGRESLVINDETGAMPSIFADIDQIPVESGPQNLDELNHGFFAVAPVLSYAHNLNPSDQVDLERKVDQEMRAWETHCSLFSKLPGEKQRNYDVLAYWKIQSVDFPLLANVARVVLAMPITSSATERLFSAVGIHYTDLRRSMKPSTLEALAKLKRLPHDV
jgi:hypothetical protein